MPQYHGDLRPAKEMDEGELHHAFTQRCRFFRLYFEEEGGSDSYDEIATKLREFADFCEAADARFEELTG